MQWFVEFTYLPYLLPCLHTCHKMRLRKGQGLLIHASGPSGHTYLEKQRLLLADRNDISTFEVCNRLLLGAVMNMAVKSFDLLRKGR